MFEKLFQKRLKRIEKRGERQKAKQEMIDKYAEYYPSSKRKVSNIMLVIIVIAIVGYAIASFVLQYYTSVEISSTLTGCWFSFWGAEIVSLASIRVSKVIKESRYDKFINDTTDENEDEDALG